MPSSLISVCEGNPHSQTGFKWRSSGEQISAAVRTPASIHGRRSQRTTGAQKK